MTTDSPVARPIFSLERELPALAEAVHNTLDLPEDREMRVPTVEDLARVWFDKDLGNARDEWWRRHMSLWLHLASHPAGTAVLANHMIWLSMAAGAEREDLPELGQETDWEEFLAPTAAFFDSWEGGMHMVPTLREIHHLWALATDNLKIRTAKGAKLLHPLAPMIRAWMLGPIDVRPNRHEDAILPRSIAMAPRGDRREAQGFLPAAHNAPGHRPHPFLPGFGADRGIIGLPLELYYLGDPDPHGGHGRSAPLALRLFVLAVRRVPMGQRDSPTGVVLSMPVRELRNRLYPGRKDPTLERFLEMLDRAAAALDSRQARIPWQNPETGRWTALRVVDFQGLPRDLMSLDDELRLRVDLPPGSTDGPKITPQLDDWGVKSGPAYRMLINLAYHWYEPGRTHHPVSRSGKGHWVRREVLSAYPEISDKLLAELAYPLASNRQRRKLAFKARRVLAALGEAGELRVVEDRWILPAGYNY